MERFLQTPEYIIYRPRNSLYKVLFRGKIKVQLSDEWVDGLIYQSVSDSSQVYARPLTAFSENFEFIY